MATDNDDDDNEYAAFGRGSKYFGQERRFGPDPTYSGREQRGRPLRSRIMRIGTLTQALLAIYAVLGPLTLFLSNPFMMKAAAEAVQAQNVEDIGGLKGRVAVVEQRLTRIDHNQLLSLEIQLQQKLDAIEMRIKMKPDDDYLKGEWRETRQRLDEIKSQLRGQ